MSVPHSRVDERGDDVHDEVDDGHNDGDEDHDALHGHEVAGLEVVGQHESQSLPFEGGLGQDRAGEHERDLHAHDGDDRDERRTPGVLGEQAPLRDAARAGGLHVAGVVGGDDVGAYQADEHAGGEQAQGERGQHGVAQHVGEHLAVAQLQRVDDVEAGGRDETLELHLAGQVGTARGGQHVEPDGEDELEHNAQIKPSAGGAENRTGIVMETNL